MSLGFQLRCYWGVGSCQVAERIQRKGTEVRKAKWGFIKWRVGSLRWVAALSLFGSAVMRYRSEGAEYSLGRELPGELYSLIFIPAPPSWGEGGFLCLVSLDWKCHGVSAWWELLIWKANFTVIRTWWAKDYIQMPEIPSFSHLSLSASRTLITPKCVFSMSVQRTFFSLSAQRLPLLIRCMVSCNLACAPLSLFIFSYLPAQRKRRSRVECHYLLNSSLNSAWASWVMEVNSLPM